MRQHHLRRSAPHTEFAPTAAPSVPGFFSPSDCSEAEPNCAAARSAAPSLASPLRSPTRLPPVGDGLSRFRARHAAIMPAAYRRRRPHSSDDSDLDPSDAPLLRVDSETPWRLLAITAASTNAFAPTHLSPWGGVDTSTQPTRRFS